MFFRLYFLFNTVTNLQIYITNLIVFNHLSFTQDFYPANSANYLPLSGTDSPGTTSNAHLSEVPRKNGRLIGCLVGKQEEIQPLSC
jgi:hypothetical protein